MLFHRKRIHLPVQILGLCWSAFLLASCGSGNSTSTPTTAPAAAPPAAVGTAVQVSVVARDTEGDQLHYRWAATEGTINNVDAPNTTWTIPPGSGLQFAYVLVSDTKGGYTESRAATLTMASVPQGPTVSITPPTPPARGFAWGALHFNRTGASRNVYLPGVQVQLTGGGQTFTTTTDLKGEFFVSNLPIGTYTATYTIPGRTSVAFDSSVAVVLASLPTSPSASAYGRQAVNGSLTTALRITGRVALQDGSLCAIRNEFFTHSTQPNLLTGPRSATVQLLDTNNNPLSTVVSINHYGDFLITRNALVGSTNARLRVQCEQAPDKIVNVIVPVSGDFVAPAIIIDSRSNPSTPNTRPIISSMTVTLGGQDIGRPDLPKATTLLPEMELAPGDDAFLTYKGIDSRKGACAYYKAIGAVQDCDADGFPTGTQLTLSQWKSRFNLSPFSNGNPTNPPISPEVKALFINRMDLNFARDMQGVILQNSDLAYNVCNYPGPQDVTNPLGAPKRIGEETQPDINLAIENARRGIGMVACVAMDYSVTPGLNGGQPFTKFYTFGPSENLLLSISLDGRREKFMPGSCVGCHGGDAYGGQFPIDGSGNGNLQSYFLPFDVANFAFSTNAGFTRADMIGPLKILNTLLRDSTPPPGVIRPVTSDAQALIAGWYPPLPAPQTNEPNLSFAPSIYSPAAQQACNACHLPGHSASAMYLNVIGPSCRVCHASNSFVPDRQAGGLPRITFSSSPPSHHLKSSTICGGDPDLKLNHTMPNTLVAFERFWLSAGTGGATDQVANLFQFSSGACSGTRAAPHPGP